VGVTFATAQSGAIASEIRAVGQVTFDETRVKAIAPKVDGWVEHLHVDFTGREVREGEPLLSIYSPMLVSAQEELLLALQLARDVDNGTEEAKRSAADLVASARRRLSYWDIPGADVAALEQRGKVTRTLTLRAPVSGVVLEKAVISGQKIMAGETLFRVADLRTVWVEGEIFERDVASVRLGARVSVELQAYPGEKHRGSLSYVYPTVDPSTRTTRVRVELPNARLRLRPGMYATMVLPGLQRSGVVTIPRSAVLATGKRVIAFVRMDDGMLAPREIVTGLTSDDRVEVLSGLAAGDVVVASATFLVDAESNLGAALGAMQGMDMGAPPSRAATPDTAMPGLGSIPGTRMDRGAADSARKPSPSEPHVHPPE
jgi:Cu(I)/Ag(I) efflux system membrane fusion protein